MTVDHTGQKQMPPCPRCNGKGFLVIKTPGGDQRKRCVACGGSKVAGPRTK